MSGLSRDPDRAAAWAMRSRKPLRRTPMKRGGRIRQQGAKANRERPALDAFRTAIAQRSRGLCELGTLACPPGPHPAAHAHHLAPSDRDRGIHDPDRGLAACARGHAYVHANPAEAYERGWLIRDGGVA